MDPVASSWNGERTAKLVVACDPILRNLATFSPISQSPALCQAGRSKSSPFQAKRGSVMSLWKFICFLSNRSKRNSEASFPSLNQYIPHQVTRLCDRHGAGQRLVFPGADKRLSSPEAGAITSAPSLRGPSRRSPPPVFGAAPHGSDPSTPPCLRQVGPGSTRVPSRQARPSEGHLSLRRALGLCGSLCHDRLLGSRGRRPCSRRTYWPMRWRRSLDLW